MPLYEPVVSMTLWQLGNRTREEPFCPTALWCSPAGKGEWQPAAIDLLRTHRDIPGLRIRWRTAWSSGLIQVPSPWVPLTLPDTWGLLRSRCALELLRARRAYNGAAGWVLDPGESHRRDAELGCCTQNRRSSGRGHVRGEDTAGDPDLGGHAARSLSSAMRLARERRTRALFQPRHSSHRQARFS